MQLFENLQDTDRQVHTVEGLDLHNALPVIGGMDQLAEFFGLPEVVHVVDFASMELQLCLIETNEGKDGLEKEEDDERVNLEERKREEEGEEERKREKKREKKRRTEEERHTILCLHMH